MKACKRGHEFTPENTRSQHGGYRLCIACEKRRGRAYYLANRELTIRRARQWALDHPEEYQAQQDRYTASFKGWLNQRRAALKGERERIVARLEELSAEEEELWGTR